VPIKTIKLSHEDLASVQRLLSNLTDSEPGAAAEPGEIAPDRYLRIARYSLSFRKRRADYLHPAMLGEPAYDMLLGLYIAQAEELPVTAARLGEIADVAQSSALRWIEYLVAKQLVVREPHPNHKRASVLKLSPKGRAALEGMFNVIIEGLQDVEA
jgi:DNA-binding MarR family transcriptional regulator